MSGSATQPLLAFHSLHLDWCEDPVPPSNERTDRTDGTDATFKGFSVVRIGDTCVMDGTGRGLSAFQTDPGTVCTLVFSDGAHAIRVTDFSARFGVTGYATGRTYVDGSYVEVQLGGDDTATRTHVLYRFSGNATSDVQSPVSCDAERTKRASRGAALAHEEQTAP